MVCPKCVRFISRLKACWVYICSLVGALLYPGVATRPGGKTTHGSEAPESVSDQTRVELALRESEALFTAFMNNTSVLTWMKDEALRYVYCNAAFERQQGVTLAAIRGQDDFALWPPETARVLQAHDHAALQSEKVLETQERVQDRQGQLHDSLVFKFPFRNASGMRYVGGMAIDVTERKQTEEALRERERLLSECQRIAHIGSWRWDLTGPHQWSDETYRIFGVSRETFIPDEVAFLGSLHPEDRAAMQAWIAACESGAKPTDLEFRTLHPDGTIRWLNGRGELSYDSAGKPAQISGTVQDITERKQGEATLEEATRMLNSIVDRLPGFIYRCANHPEFPLEALSQGVFDLLGYPAEEFLSGQRAVSSTIEPGDRARMWTEIQAGLESCGSFVVEYRSIRANGKPCWVWEKGAGVYDGDTLVALEGLVIDITERKQAEQALRESELKFRTMIEASLVPFALADERDNITHLNAAFVATLGYNLEDVPTVADWWPKACPDAEYRQWAASTWQAHSDKAEQTGTPFEPIELNIRCKDGTLRTAMVSEVSLGKRFKGHYLITIYDITDRKLAERSLLSLNAELEQRIVERTAGLERAVTEAEKANKAKGEFLSRMSHELRTPMNAILGFSQLLETTSLDGAQQESVNHILMGGQHLLGIINDILEITRIESSTFSVNLTPVDLREVLSECVDLMLPLATERGVALTLAKSASAHAVADRQRLRQVILNLVSNAIKYNIRNGQASISIVDTNAESVTIEVKDTGIGISKTMLGRLFTPFDRLGVESTGIEGTGLGLSLSRSLTECMGGKLTVESQEGAGSCFRVHLRSFRNHSTAPVTPLQERVSAGPASVKRKVLAIDDNPVNLQLLQGIFEEFPNLEVVTAVQGKLGLELAAKHPPDVVLLDLHLQDMDGRDVLLALRGNPSFGGVPVIMISADAHSAQAEQLLRDGAFRYITKPFNIRELVNAVHEAIETGRDRV